MKALKKISSFLNRIFIFIAAIALVLMMLLGFGNVLFRTVWKPIEGSYELIGFLGAVTTALALGYAQIRKNHISVDIITNHYSRRWKKIAHGISYLSTAIFFTLASWQTTLWGTNVWHSGERSETLRIIFFPFVFVVALGFAFLALILLIDFITLFEKESASPMENL